jgi:hypothetical protein
MATISKFLKYTACAFVGIIALVAIAAMYGAATPNADIEVKRAAESRRAAAQARSEQARQAGEKLGKAIADAGKRSDEKRKIYDAGFQSGKLRAESKKPMPDISVMNKLARDIIGSYGLESTNGDLEQQFRSGYGRGYLTGK